MQVYFNLFYIVYIRYRGKLKCKQNQKHWGCVKSAVQSPQKEKPAISVPMKLRATMHIFMRFVDSMIMCRLILFKHRKADLQKKLIYI